jgi:glutathionyl-hydroquinone reductase
MTLMAGSIPRLIMVFTHPFSVILPSTLDSGQRMPWMLIGVYRSGFATSQEAYEEAVKSLFESLDRVEGILSRSRYLVSNDRVTLADVRLFTTLIRFDTVYHGHFKCNRRKLKEYTNIYNYMLDLYQRPPWRSTVDHTHIKQHVRRFSHFLLLCAVHFVIFTMCMCMCVVI